MSNIETLQQKIAAVNRLLHEEFGDMSILSGKYHEPSLDLLQNHPTETTGSSIQAEVLESKLREFGFEGTVERVRKGPVITRYEVRLASGVRLAQVRKVSEDLAIALMSDKVRIQAPIPGTALVGIEVANESAATIGLRSVIQKARESSYELPLAIGTDTVGEPAVFDLTKMPHLLIAGQTGSGKSVAINAMILSLIYTKTPQECQLVLVDPKRVEMSFYKNIPHLRGHIVTEPEDALEVFQGLVKEMERRYRVLASRQVRNINSYNEVSTEKMPYIVTVVDEMADLMMTSGKELEACIVRLAQLARAVGIHLILATQKPVVKVITGLIKSNMPSRIAFRVSSKVDSGVILDCNGAEKLLGKGDMLFLNPESSEPERFHGAWVSDKEILSVTTAVRG